MIWYSLQGSPPDQPKICSFPSSTWKSSPPADFLFPPPLLQRLIHPDKWQFSCYNPIKTSFLAAVIASLLFLLFFIFILFVHIGVMVILILILSIHRKLLLAFKSFKWLKGSSSGKFVTFQVLFNLATCSNYSITNVKIPVLNLVENVNNGQLKMVNVNY